MTSAPITPSFDDVLARIDGVEGWLSPAQARALYGAAARCPAGGRIVEIGSFRGRSTIVLASAAPPGTEIVAIDPHAGNDRGPQEIDGFADQAADDHTVFLANLERAGVTDRVRYVRRFSDEAHTEVADPIDVLYVDGAHRFGPARADIHDWGRRVGDGGMLLIHDSFASVGVTMAILVELLTSGRFRYLGRAGSLTMYAAGPIGAKARLTSALRQLAQLPWFVRNVLIKVLIVARLGALTRLLGHREATWPY